jgi:hypothetical protein
LAGHLDDLSQEAEAMEADEALLLELEWEPAAACSGCERAASRHEKALNSSAIKPLCCAQSSKSSLCRRRGHGFGRCGRRTDRGLAG